MNIHDLTFIACYSITFLSCVIFVGVFLYRTEKRDALWKKEFDKRIPEQDIPLPPEVKKYTQLGKVAGMSPEQRKAASIIL